MDDDWFNIIIGMVRQEGGDVPPEYRRYVKLEEGVKYKRLKVEKESVEDEMSKQDGRAADWGDVLWVEMEISLRDTSQGMLTK